MYTVYFEDKTISFTSDDQPAGGCGAVTLNVTPGDDCFAKVLEKLENNKHVRVKSNYIDVVFAGFCSGFRHVEAAGGLVTNGRGDSLMIYRKGWWDLPKGHVDGGESTVQCAVREIREECGLSRVEPGAMIARTSHIYRLDGHWIMKHTDWFAMRSDDAEPVPQAEEGILIAEWVPAGQLSGRVGQSYPTIKEVFRKAGKIHT